MAVDGYIVHSNVTDVVYALIIYIGTYSVFKMGFLRVYTQFLSILQ